VAVILGIVGAVASLVGVGVAFYTWWAPRRTRLDVRIAEPGSTYPSRAVLTVHNRSERPIQIITMGFDLPKAPRQVSGEPMVYQLWGTGSSFDPPEATYPPRTVAPGSSWQTYVYRSVLEGLLGRPPVVTAWVCTADRKVFKSKPTELFGSRWRQQLAEIEEAERRLRHGPLG